MPLGGEGLCLVGGAISQRSQHVSFQECESDPCCEPGTCRLRSGAECAYGDCCKNCRVRDPEAVFGSVLQGLGEESVGLAGAS